MIENIDTLSLVENIRHVKIQINQIVPFNLFMKGNFLSKNMGLKNVGPSRPKAKSSFKEEPNPPILHLFFKLTVVRFDS